MKYTPAVSRLFLFLDEWIGIFCLFYFILHQEWFLLGAFGLPWAIAIYGIGYPMQWAFERRESGRAPWAQRGPSDE